MGKLGLHAVADLDNREVGRDLQDGAGDDIAHAVAELLVDALATCLAHHGGDDALGVLRGDAAHVVRGDVALFELVVLAGFLVGLAHGNQLVDINAARGAVDRHARIPFQIENVLIAFRKRRLEALDQIELVDLLLMRQGLQSFDQFRSCHKSSFPKS